MHRWIKSEDPRTALIYPRDDKLLDFRKLLVSSEMFELMIQNLDDYGVALAAEDTDSTAGRAPKSRSKPVCSRVICLSTVDSWE